jgi:hypothetical protein
MKWGSPVGGGARKKRKVTTPPSPPAPAGPTIYAATLGAAGTVVRVPAPITQAQAVSLRQLGLDIVVCGPVLAHNYALARDIEQAAVGAGNWIRHTRDALENPSRGRCLPAGRANLSGGEHPGIAPTQRVASDEAVNGYSKGRQAKTRKESLGLFGSRPAQGPVKTFPTLNWVFFSMASRTACSSQAFGSLYATVTVCFEVEARIWSSSTHGRVESASRTSFTQVRGQVMPLTSRVTVLRLGSIGLSGADGPHPITTTPSRSAGNARRMCILLG